MIDNRESGIYVLLYDCGRCKHCTGCLVAVILHNRKYNTFIVFNGFSTKSKTSDTSIYIVIVEKNTINNIVPDPTGIFGLPLRNLCALSTALDNISMIKIETSAF